MVREYLDTEATNLERAERLGEKAERLEKAGTPSESVRNRAERARREVAAGLGALRAHFVESTREGAEGREGARAFDRVVEALCPAYGLPHGSPRRGNPWEASSARRRRLSTL